MNRIVVKSKVGADGILRLDLPVGQAEADHDVQVTVEPVPQGPMTQEEWRRLNLSTAGKWHGPFERPKQGDYEELEPMQ